MLDLEKVVKGLGRCIKRKCDGCEEIDASHAPWDCPAYDSLIENAFELLKEMDEHWVGELVRCKDCKHYRQATCSAGAGIAYPPPDDWFCADGEKRTDDALGNSKY